MDFGGWGRATPANPYKVVFPVMLVGLQSLFKTINIINPIVMLVINKISRGSHHRVTLQPSALLAEDLGLG